MVDVIDTAGEQKVKVAAESTPESNDDAALLEAAFQRILASFSPEPALTAQEHAQLRKAFEIASRAHHGQRRRSGEPYLLHPLRVSADIGELGLDVASVVAGILHDSVEDSELTVYEVTESFGSEVARLVDGVTKLGKVPYLSRKEQQAENFRKMLLAMSEDIRVLIVKLADRLDNMRTLDHMPSFKRERIARETMDIHAPLAGRLGMEAIRSELQDISFSYLDPVTHAQLRTRMAELDREYPGFAEQVRADIEATFEAGGARDGSGAPLVWREDVFGAVEVRCVARTAHKLHQLLGEAGRTNVESAEIADLHTYQIVTDERAGCYVALGQIHAGFKHVPGSFRDYFAIARPNRYEALHTSVVDQRGTRIEIQLRSRAGDSVAERGICVHLQRGSARGARDLQWLDGLLDMGGSITDPHEFIEEVKSDLFAHEVYAFTPRGDVHVFPKGSTPIDFAFAIHTDVGLHCSGARVNGQVVPLRYRLRQGDTVEILVSPKANPKREWLNLCQSSRARTRVRQHLRDTERTRMEGVGRELIDTLLSSAGRSLAKLEKAKTIDPSVFDALGVARDRGLAGIYAAVGEGGVESAEAVRRLIGDSEVEEIRARESGLFSSILRLGRRSRASKANASSGRAGPGMGTSDGGEGRGGVPIVITRARIGSAGGTIHLARCCSPVPGDPLVGYLRPGRGIQAHVQGCPRAIDEILGSPVRLTWDERLELERPVSLVVRTLNEVGLLAEMSRAFKSQGVNIRNANCRAYDRGRRASNTFEVTVRTSNQLQDLVESLKGIDGVISVDRVFNVEAEP